MADSSITRYPILDLIPGGCWVKRQLHTSIRYVSIASILMRLVYTVGRVLRRLRGEAHDFRTPWQIP